MKHIAGCASLSLCRLAACIPVSRKGLLSPQGGGALQGWRGRALLAILKTCNLPRSGLVQHAFRRTA